MTQGSFDTYLWQTVERKARFIGQVMKGRLDVREIEDIGDTALSYADVKALAAGDTRLMEKANLEGEVVRLERLERAWHRSQRGLQYRLDRGPVEIEVLDDKLHQVELDGDDAELPPDRSRRPADRWSDLAEAARRRSPKPGG